MALRLTRSGGRSVAGTYRGTRRPSPSGGGFPSAGRIRLVSGCPAPGNTPKDTQ